MAKIIQNRKRSAAGHVEPAVLRCDCGALVALTDGLDNPCSKCEANYNMSGQRVLFSRDPRVEEPYDDDY